MLATPDRLKELVNYDPETGEIIWKTRPFDGFANSGAGATWNKRFAGKPAFAASKGHGYKHGSLGGRLYSAHRVAWAVHYGEWPGVIDHINGDPSDNRIANLRSVDWSENSKNKRLQSNSPQAHFGIRLREGKWQARIKVRGVLRHLGSFKTYDDALLARRAAEARLGFHQNHGRKN